MAGYGKWRGKVSELVRHVSGNGAVRIGDYSKRSLFQIIARRSQKGRIEFINEVKETIQY